MLISKFDLYKSEWLELVFDDRNKEYGAYNLRQQNAGDTAKAMTITFSGLILIGGIFFICKANPAVVSKPDRRVIVVISPPPVLPTKKIDPPTPPKPLKAEPPAKPVATIQDLVPVVVVDTRAKNPVENADIDIQVGPETAKGVANGIDIPKSDDPGSDGPPAPDMSIHDLGGLDVMPQPVGGEGAWAKFLSRNLRFPPPAQDDGVSGKVFLSFVIEKDGTLSNITVIRPAGHGFDEEALRVLKLAKAWKPGVQNGQPVRVKYTIPISFQFADGN